VAKTHFVPQALTENKKFYNIWKTGKNEDRRCRSNFVKENEFEVAKTN